MRVIHSLKSSSLILFLKKHYVKLLLTLVISIGFSLRIWQLGEQSLWIDEGYSINAAQATLKYGYPLLDSGRTYGGSLLHTYIVSGFMKIFGLNPWGPWSARLPSVLFGTALIFIIYKLTFALFKNKWLALFVAFFLAFSSWQIAWSRQARMYTQLQFFFYTALYYLFLWLKKYDKKNLIYFILFSLGACFSHLFGFFLIPIFALCFLFSQILFPKKRINWKQKIDFKKKNNFIILIFSLIALILSVRPSYNFLSRTLIEVSFYDFTHFYLGYLFENLKLFTWPAIISLTIGLIWGLFNKKYFWQTIFLATAFSFPLVIIINYTPLCHMRYLFPLFPLIIVLLCYLILQLSEILKALLIKPDFFRKFDFPIIVLFFLSVLILHQSLNFLPKSHYALERGSPQPDFKQAYSIIRKIKSPTDIVISPHPHLTNIYLQEKGYWLPISLSGKSSELKKYLLYNSFDPYVNAPIIRNPKHLQQLLKTENGFIILDGMTLRGRLDIEMLATLQIPQATQQIYHSGKGLNEIYLLDF